ncbi:hypothetical protein D3C71_1791070 [compost metagenome]
MRRVVAGCHFIGLETGLLVGQQVAVALGLGQLGRDLFAGQRRADIGRHGRACGPGGDGDGDDGEGSAFHDVGPLLVDLVWRGSCCFPVHGMNFKISDSKDKQHKKNPCVSKNEIIKF